MPIEAIEAIDESVPLRERFRVALSAAMKTRARKAISGLRSALGAIDNAEAIDTLDIKAGAIGAVRSDSALPKLAAAISPRQISSRSSAPKSPTGIRPVG